MKMSTAIAIRLGIIIGSRTLRKAVKRVSPSRRAASSMSRGTSIQTVRSTQTANAALKGTLSAISVPRRS
jgi:hypothetical protein